MTQATKTATIEEYMELVKEGNHDKVVTFINECFGTDEDFDNEACDAFANEAQAPLNEFLAEEVAKMPEATPDMMPQAEATMEAANDAQQEAPAEEASEES
jgi:hypothetical protein